MRQRDVDRLFRKWQAALGLADWEIELRLRRDPGDLEAEGTCEYDVHARTAIIHVDPRCPDPELASVHELLHLWLAPMIGRSTAKVFEEQAVEAISKALVTLKREGAP